MKTLISREPWWAKPPALNQSELEVEWGYLEIYSVGGKFEFEFVPERPTDTEIVNRKACRLAAQTG